MIGSARSVYLAFALAWLIVAGALVGGIVSASAAAGLETWSICAPSGNAAPDDGERPAHAGGACCTTLCGQAALDVPNVAIASAPDEAAFAAHDPRGGSHHSGPAGIGPQSARAPPR